MTILQAYTGASDDEAIEALTMDCRWQLACDGLDCAAPPVSGATLVRCRAVMIAHGLGPLVRARLEAARQVRAQDVERFEDGAVTLRQGVTDTSATCHGIWTQC